jgi:16S rRNA (guanine527-N7)-methyltransferase
VTAAQRAQLLGYLDLLAKWNKTYNLTAIRERERMVTHHLLDALAVLPQLPQQHALRVLDVGSGGGIPGLPFAIVRPDWQLTLVDASHKKVAFLTQAAIELTCPTSPRADASRTADGARPRDLARFGPRHLCRDVGAASAPHGLLIAMKGVHPDEESPSCPRVTVMAKPVLAVPGLDAARHAIVMQRASDRAPQ